MRAIISEVPGAVGAQRKGSNKSGTATGERAIYADTRRLRRTWLGNGWKNGFWKEATADAKAHQQWCRVPEKVLEDKGSSKNYADAGLGWASQSTWESGIFISEATRNHSLTDCAAVHPLRSRCQRARKGSGGGQDWKQMTRDKVSAAIHMTNMAQSGAVEVVMRMVQ